MEENLENCLVIDGNSIMNRAFYGIKLLSTSDGLYTNAIFGFLNIYYMILDKLKPTYVAVAFDLKAPTFRHEMFVEYKAHRRMMPDELKIQMPIIKDILSAMNIPIYEIEGFEADDILGTIAKSNEERNIFTYILTGDKDSLQLISDKTSVVMPSNKMGKTEYTIYTPSVLYEKLGIKPSQVIDIKALMGDSSDNIPGVPGIGEKTAYSLIGKYNNIDNIYENIDTVECTPSVKRKLLENKAMAYLSYKLATINRDVKIDLDYNKLKLSDVNAPKLTSLFERLSFKRFIDRYTDSPDSIAKTDANIEFFKEFDDKNILDIDKDINLFKSSLSESERVSVCIINHKKMELENIFAINMNNKIMYLNLKSSKAKDVLLSVINSSCVKIGYDIKTIYKECLKYGISDFSTFQSDIKIAYYLLNSTENNYDIENIAYNILDINIPNENISTDSSSKKEVQTSLFDIDALENNGDNGNIELSETQKKYIYGVLNSIFRLDTILNEKLNKLNMYSLYKDIEMPLIETLANIENNGMYINREKLLDFGKILSNDILNLESKIYDIAGETFNINSPAQLGKVLFEDLGLSISKKTKKGYSTDKETLESLIDEHEIIKYILDYRAMTKLKSTYVDGLIDCIGKDNRIHTTFMQTVAATGRLSSACPNLQNIPVRTDLGAKIRDAFEAEGDNIIIDADYSQIELRVLAHMASDQRMIVAFKEGKDIHAITAAEVFNVPEDEVTHELRNKAKAVNFGIVYGISGFGLSKSINSTVSEANKYIKDYLDYYYKVKLFMDDKIEEGRNKGYVSTLFGRIRYTSELKASNKNTVMFGERVAMNTPIQGTAADIIKLAMNRLYAKLKENNLKAKIIMQVHDELIVEAPKDEKDKVIGIMRDSMQNVVKLDVPLDVSINVGKTWSEAK